MPRIKVVPYNRAQLDAMASPSTVRQPEAYPAEFYDTATFVNASTLALTFFQNTNADKTLSNMDAAASFPSPQYFIVHYLTVDYLFPTLSTAVTAAGNLDDLHRLMNGTGRGTFTLSISGKPYGPFRLRTAHSAGGPVGFGWGQAPAAPNEQQYGHVGPHDGGYCFNGALVIPPTTNFAVVLNFGAVQTLNTNNLLIQVGLFGVIYRKVV